jgi:dTDP-4-amino-4,6-dideoxygalactose transaminase
VHWDKPVWEHRALNLPTLALPQTQEICRQAISLPMSAETTVEEAEITAGSIREFFKDEAYQQQPECAKASD